MKYNVNYNEIFFDRYSLTEPEKKNAAMYILDKALTEKAIEYKLENNTLFLYDLDCEKEIGFIRLTDILKREFFILISPEIEEEITETIVDIMAEAEKYIHKQYLYDTFSIQYVCEKLNITRKALDKLFVEKHALTAKDYLRKLRVTRAKELIKTGENMEEIASLCGFGSVKTMQRAFKAVLGSTPGKHRQ